MNPTHKHLLTGVFIWLMASGLLHAHSFDIPTGIDESLVTSRGGFLDDVEYILADGTTGRGKVEFVEHNGNKYVRLVNSSYDALLTKFSGKNSLITWINTFHPANDAHILDNIYNAFSSLDNSALTRLNTALQKTGGQIHTEFGELLVKLSEGNTQVLARISGSSWDNKLPQLVDDLANAPFKTKLLEKPELVEAWETAIKHSGLRTNVTALNKLDNIISSGRVTSSKLKSAIDGSLGDVLNAADNTNLGVILDRLNLSHVNDAHIDKILQRLNDYPNVKQDLINHSDWFETFDDILDNPGKYWEIVSEAELPNNAALNHWAQGYWWKNLRDVAKEFEEGAALTRFKNLYGLANNKVVTQVTLLIDGTRIRIDFLGFKNGKYYLGEAKFTTKDKNWATDWLSASTDPQKIVFQAFQNGNVNSIVVKGTDSQKLSDLLEIGLSNNSVINFANTKLDVIGSNANQQTIKSVISLK